MRTFREHFWEIVNVALLSQNQENVFMLRGICGHSVDGANIEILHVVTIMIEWD